MTGMLVVVGINAVAGFFIALYRVEIARFIAVVFDRRLEQNRMKNAAGVVGTAMVIIGVLGYAIVIPGL